MITYFQPLLFNFIWPMPLFRLLFFAYVSTFIILRSNCNEFARERGFFAISFFFFKFEGTRNWCNLFYCTSILIFNKLTSSAISKPDLQDKNYLFLIKGTKKRANPFILRTPTRDSCFPLIQIPLQFAQFPSNCILTADANCPKFWLSFQVKLLRRDSVTLRARLDVSLVGAVTQKQVFSPGGEIEQQLRREEEEEGGREESSLGNRKSTRAGYER